MRLLVITLLTFTATAVAQENPISASVKWEYELGRGVIVRAAEKMPETEYGFRATPDVRKFGEIVGHVADSAYVFCSAAKGEKNPSDGTAEKSKTTKADLVQALKDAFAYCDAVYAVMTDTIGAQTVKFGGRDVAKVGVLAFNNMHDYEHYGNMVTYLRLKNIVPPSSEPRTPPASKK